MAKRILVVDDDMMCLKTVQKYLADEGYEVVGALSGMQAIHIVQEAKVDLLLLDIEMPAMSGFAALEQVRLLPNGKHLPAIFFYRPTGQRYCKMLCRRRSRGLHYETGGKGHAVRTG